MAINTKKVQGRRPVRYESLEDLLAEAERFATAEVRPLGNWSQGQIYEHLAISLNASIDGVGFSIPAPIRFIMSLLYKKKFLTNELPAGYKSTDKFVPSEDAKVQDALESLRAAIERQKQEPNRVPHPAFGKIGKDGWNDFHLRHAEMHMSFLIPSEEQLVNANHVTSEPQGVPNA